MEVAFGCYLILFAAAVIAVKMAYQIGLNDGRRESENKPWWE